MKNKRRIKATAEHLKTARRLYKIGLSMGCPVRHYRMLTASGDQILTQKQLEKRIEYCKNNLRKILNEKHG